MILARTSALALVSLLAACGARTPLHEDRASATSTSQVSPHEPVAVTVGLLHACALLADGTVWCWGAGNLGQLGDGRSADSSVPVQVSGVEHAVSVVAGGSHTCARLDDGGVRCWGWRATGQLGDGAPLFGESAPTSPTPLTPALPATTALGAGDGHTCAASDAGVRCFGINDFGELGDGAFARSSSPRLVLDLDSATQLALGSSHSCALSSDGSVHCWGNGEDGQLGTPAPDVCGTFACSRRAVAVEGLPPAAQIAAAANRTCAVLQDGTVSCFGRLPHGAVVTPEPVSGLASVQSIALGRTHGCARTRDGEVLCWGDGERGQLGPSATASCPGSVCTRPVPVMGVPPPSGLAAGGDTTCMVGAGRVLCWGKNDRGQLGDGSTTDTDTPVRVQL